MKEQVTCEAANAGKGLRRLTFFRPGMLNRMKGDGRFMEEAFLSLFGGLRVDDLATAMILDAQLNKPPPVGQILEHRLSQDLIDFVPTRLA